VSIATGLIGIFDARLNADLAVVAAAVGEDGGESSMIGSPRGGDDERLSKLCMGGTGDGVLGEDADIVERANNGVCLKQVKVSFVVESEWEMRMCPWKGKCVTPRKKFSLVGKLCFTANNNAQQKHKRTEIKEIPDRHCHHRLFVV